jgi:hypothetical protein
MSAPIAVEDKPSASGALKAGNSIERSVPLFLSDSSTGRAASGLTVASAEGHWDVVSHNWDGMKLQLRDVAIDIEKGWKRITG